jgi:hypothetical protein
MRKIFSLAGIRMILARFLPGEEYTAAKKNRTNPTMGKKTWRA